jgi:hypothetical protein
VLGASLEELTPPAPVDAGETARPKKKAR